MQQTVSFSGAASKTSRGISKDTTFEANDHFPKNKLGKNSVNWGNKTINISTIISGRRKMAVSFATLSTGTFATLLKTNKTVPNGGVNVPIIRLRIIITPKCTGSIPSFWMSGMKTGTKILIAATVSRKQPTMSNKMLMEKRIRYF